MAVYLVLALMTCVLACFVKREEYRPVTVVSECKAEITRGRLYNKILYMLIFFFWFVISAGRIAVGGDYWKYKSIFNYLAQNRDSMVATEVGFNLFVKIIQHIFGADGKKYLIIFAIIGFVTLFLFLKGLTGLCENFALSFFMFTVLGYYASSFNSIRNYLAFAVAFYAVRFIFRKEYWKFVLCVLLASTFHISILIVLVAYPLGLIKWKPWSVALLSVVTASFLIFPGVYKSLVFLVYPQYENSIYDTGSTSYINIARCVGVLVLSLIMYKKVLKNNQLNMFYFNMNVLALIIYSCCSFIPVISRAGYYFNIFQVVLVPHIIDAFPKKWMKIVSIVAIIVLGTAYYIMFLEASRTNGTLLLPYLNWVMH